MTYSDKSISPDSLSMTREVRGGFLRAIDQRHLVVNSIAATVEELLSSTESDPNGVIVTVHAKAEEPDDLVITVTAPHRSFVAARH